jgi:hypothetical protein
MANGAWQVSADVRAGSSHLDRARGLYHLRQYEACAELLSTADLAGFEELRLRGLALGMLDRCADAVDSLDAALELRPEDEELRASLLSAQLRSGALPDIPRAAAAGPLAELSGAAAWLRARLRLEEGGGDAAAALFGQAAALFERSSPPGVVGERIGACYAGQAISYLAAGRLEPAQHAFSRLARKCNVPPSVLSLARKVYELADAARHLSPSERVESLRPLAELVTGVRLRVRFYDQRGPVAMYWEPSGDQGDLWTPVEPLPEKRAP